MNFTTSANEAAARLQDNPQATGGLKIDSGTQQLKLLTSPDIMVDEKSKSRLHQASIKSLNERASSV